MLAACFGIRAPTLLRWGTFSCLVIGEEEYFVCVSVTIKNYLYNTHFGLSGI